MNNNSNNNQYPKLQQQQFQQLSTSVNSTSSNTPDYTYEYNTNTCNLYPKITDHPQQFSPTRPTQPTRKQPPIPQQQQPQPQALSPQPPQKQQQEYHTPMTYFQDKLPKTIQSSNTLLPNPSSILPNPDIILIKRDKYINPKNAQSEPETSFTLLVNSRDPKEAMKRLAKKENHSGAQCWLGSSYLYGINGFNIINYTRANKWLEKSANQQHPKGTYDLFKYYEKVGDVNKATFWLEKSCDLGYEEAIITMGIYSFDGTLIQQNYGKAFNYFLLGASLGVDSNTFTYLGLFFYEGRGIEINYEESYRFFYLASIQPQKPEVAQYYLGDCLYFGRGVEVNYSKSFEYFSKSASTTGILNNFYKPSDSLGYCYLRGHGVAQNFQQAQIHFKNAKKLGSPIAEKNLKTTQKCIDNAKKPMEILKYIKENQEKEAKHRQLEINQHQRGAAFDGSKKKRDLDLNKVATALKLTKAVVGLF